MNNETRSIREQLTAISDEKVFGDLVAMSREPFTRELFRFLDARPDANSLRQWASRWPEKWAHATFMLAKLAGYNEKLEVKHQGNIHHLHTISDVELKSLVVGLAGQLKEILNQKQPIIIENSPKKQRVKKSLSDKGDYVNSGNENPAENAKSLTDQPKSCG